MDTCNSCKFSKTDGLYALLNAKKSIIKVLREAIEDAERGLIAADLGGNVIKQRIARSGQGKSGGYRTIILFQQGSRAFFVYGFAKSDRDNISKAELDAFREAAVHLFDLNEEKLALLLENGALTEVTP